MSTVAPMYVKRLGIFGQLLLLFAALSMVGGVIAGIAVAMSSDDSGSIYRSAEHDNVGIGIGIAVSGVFAGVLLAFVAYWALAWAEVNSVPAAPRRSADRVPPPGPTPRR